MARSKGGFQGTMADAIAHLSNIPEGLVLAKVLEATEQDIDSSTVHVSPDLRRAKVELQSGKKVTVRVTPSVLRFRPPQNPQEYEMLYFGGIAKNGEAIVHQMQPKDIGKRKSLTFSSK